MGHPAKRDCPQQTYARPMRPIKALSDHLTPVERRLLQALSDVC